MAENNNYDIYLDGYKLNRVHEAKFLGITIDENFTWKKQVKNICKLCSRNIGVLNKIKGFLPTNAMYKLLILLTSLTLLESWIIIVGKCKQVLHQQSFSPSKTCHAVNLK